MIKDWEKPINEFLGRPGEELILFPHSLQIDEHIWAIGYLKQMGAIACAAEKDGDPWALLDHYAKFNPNLEIEPETAKQIEQWLNNGASS